VPHVLCFILFYKNPLAVFGIFIFPCLPFLTVPPSFLLSIFVMVLLFCEVYILHRFSLLNNLSPSQALYMDKSFSAVQPECGLAKSSHHCCCLSFAWSAWYSTIQTQTLGPQSKRTLTTPHSYSAMSQFLKRSATVTFPSSPGKSIVLLHRPAV
jgi:hypothetical protein